MAISYRRKIVDLQHKIANEAEKAQELIHELKKLVKENENLDVINLRNLREAKEIQKQAKNTPFAKKCANLVDRTCHKNKQRIRMIKKNPQKYSLAEYLKAHGFSESDFTYARYQNCMGTNKAKQKRCIERAKKRREKALILKKKWQHYYKQQ